MFETNKSIYRNIYIYIFIEKICVAVDCKSDTRQGRA